MYLAFIYSTRELSIFVDGLGNLVATIMAAIITSFLVFHNQQNDIFSTFAWYKTSDSAKAVAGTQLTDPSITVNAPTTSTTTYGYIVSASIARSGTNLSDTKLLLTELSAGVLTPKIWDAGGQLVTYTPASLETTYFQYTVTLTGNWATAAGDGYVSAASLTPQAKHALLSANSKNYVVDWAITGTDAARARIASASSFASEKDSDDDPGLQMTKAIADFIKLAELPNNPTDAQIAQFTGEGQTQTFDIFVRADGSGQTGGDDYAHADDSSLSFTVDGTGTISA